MGSRRASTKIKHAAFQVQKDEKSSNSMFYSDGALVEILKSCAKHKNLIKGKKIHRFVLEKGLLGKNAHVSSSLINMYSKCGALSKAKEIFDQLTSPNVVSWNALIAGYAQNGHGQMALNYFQQMLSNGPSPNSVTYVCALKACGILKAIDQGEEIHKLIVKEGLHKSNVLIGNALIDMYAKCGKLVKAEHVFRPCQGHCQGCAERGSGEKVLKCFELMQQSGLPATVATFISMLKCCGSL